MCEATHMTGIIEDLLLLARAESKAVAMSWMELSSTDFMKEVAHAVQPVYQARGVNLNTSVSVSDHFVANPGYLTLALKNILLNAAKHSAAQGTVEFSMLEDGRDIFFVIADFGEGIPEDSVPYIFDPFYRADTVRNRAAGGTGIGLSLPMAVSFMELMVGRVVNRSVKEILMLVASFSVQL